MNSITSNIKERYQKISSTIKEKASFLLPLWNFLKKYGAFLVYFNPKRYIKILDWYIIKKFIGTYIFSIILIISVAIVFDVNENLARFAQYHAPLKAIV
ncbi:MAG: hypothetical protein HXN44_05645, partial [Prevotella nanceiensis]|nr:hypothetical protein [Hoylesella nanceiensis]